MASIAIVDKKDFLSGTEDPDEISVPLGATEVDIFIDRTDLLDSKVAVAVQCFLSLNGGLSWKPWGGFGTTGGEMINSKTMVVDTKSGMISKLPEPDNKNRKLRLTITLSSGANTALKCEFK